MFMLSFFSPSLSDTNAKYTAILQFCFYHLSIAKFLPKTKEITNPISLVPVEPMPQSSP